MVGEEIKSYGLKSSSLPYYLGAFMSVERERVTVISPFISNFDIPDVTPDFKLGKDQQSSFFGALCHLSHIGVEIMIYTKKTDLREILEKNGAIAKFTRIKSTNDLHEKFFITTKFFYKGSANLTHYGMYENIEDCAFGLVSENASYLRGTVHEIDSVSKEVTQRSGTK